MKAKTDPRRWSFTPDIMGQYFWIFGIIGILVGAGVIVGGAILCWRSTTDHTCSDWDYHSPYYPLYTCGYIYTDIIAPTKCNDTLCYCRSPTYDYTCIPRPPGGVSPTLLTSGIIMIVIGAIFIVGCIILIVVSLD